MAELQRCPNGHAWTNEHNAHATTCPVCGDETPLSGWLENLFALPGDSRVAAESQESERERIPNPGMSASAALDRTFALEKEPARADVEERTIGAESELPRVG